MAISANSMLKVKRTGITAYIVFLMLPLYWLLNMSFKTNQEILSTFTLWPQDFTLDNYITIFTDSVLVQRLHQFAYLRSDEHGYRHQRCTTSCLCLLAL